MPNPDASAAGEEGSQSRLLKARPQTTNAIQEPLGRSAADELKNGVLLFLAECPEPFWVIGYGAKFVADCIKDALGRDVGPNRVASAVKRLFNVLRPHHRGPLGPRLPKDA